MAFDIPTRRRLEKFVRDARTLMAAEFADQLRSLYGISADSPIVPVERLGHLDEPQRATATLLRQRVDYLIRTHPDERYAQTAAVGRVAREQAFTLINRLAAIRIAEAPRRGILIESIARGYQSRGFQTFERVAGSGLGETYDRYRRFLFCLFDELAVDLGALFDRRSPFGLLFPREAALLGTDETPGLIRLINAPDLIPLWDEDETIGWIYQYYNDEAERKKMRDTSKGGSAAPRNSYELAVRNQFFTPRYVVQFLTDNTLGRLWFEMTQGRTALARQCRYLVRRPREIFLGNLNVISCLPSAAEWVQEVARTADFSQLPESPALSDISDFALLIDGYAIAEQDRMGDLLAWFNPQFEGFIERGEALPEDALSLWLILFAAQGSYLKDGIWREEDHTPILDGIRSLYAALRTALQRPEPATLSQEERLALPHFIPYRPIKDPRTLRLIDPACGSMHFGLYAFDLMEVIYEEALDPAYGIRDALLGEVEWERYPKVPIQLGTVMLDPTKAPVSNYSSQEVPPERAFVVMAEKADGGDGVQIGKPYLIDAETTFRVPFQRRVPLGEFNLSEALEDGWFTEAVAAEFVQQVGCFRFEGTMTEEEAERRFRLQIPRLIMERNIHGIDIDPRAVQIAGLSLWLRAQRMWSEARVPVLERPRITKSNIVCAEAMPGDKDLLAAFVEDRFPAAERPIFLHLLGKIFDQMSLAGEAGSLLRIEEEIRTAIEEARTLWERAQSRKELFSEDALEAVMKPGTQRELSGLESAVALLPVRGKFWKTAEERIYGALRAFAEESESGFQQRLFANDAARGFAFIDLCRETYDVAVMNPPFGNFSKLWAAQSKVAYPNSSNDILAAFVERFLLRLNPGGRLGAITSRTCFFLTTFKDWRLNVVLEQSAIRSIADLGQGVMDNAMVEAAAYVLERARPTPGTTVFRAIADSDRQAALEACIDAHNAATPEDRLFLADQAAFHLLPDSPFVYWIGGETISQFKTGQTFEPTVGNVRQGMATGDDPRYVRAVWEVAHEDTIFCYYPTNGDGFCSIDDPIVQDYFRRRDRGTPRWAFHVKSGSSQPWYSPITLKINWAEDGNELKNFKNAQGKLRSRPQNTIFYYRPGFSWTRRAVRFFPYAIPGNCIPSVSRYMAFPDYGLQAEAIGVCASRLVSAFLRFYAEFWQRPNFLVDTLKMLSWPELPEEAKAHFEALIAREVEQRRLAYQNHEPFHEFLLPVKIRDFSQAGRSLAFDPTALLDEATETMVAEAFGFTPDQARAVERDLMEAIEYQRGPSASAEQEPEPAANAEALENAPEDAEAGEDSDDNSDFVLDYSKAAIEEAHISYLVGCVFGRWDIRFATGEKSPPALPHPFAPLPICPPGMLQNAIGLPAGSGDLPTDYPLEIPWEGILVDDENHPKDIVALVENALELIHGENHTAVETAACASLGVPDFRSYFRRFSTGKVKGFFEHHLDRYTKSKRKAPIYWPLSTRSGNYTLWIYYHRLNEQTLFRALADFVDPKLRDVDRDIRIAKERSDTDKVEELQEFDTELRELKATIEETIRLPWKPNLNDGVLITASPLWKLFRLNRWQTALKDTWEKLQRGDLDWAHLARAIRPTQVEAKCRTDRSLAIAHGLEHLCPPEPPKPARRGRKKTKSLDSSDSIAGTNQGELVR